MRAKKTGTHLRKEQIAEAALKLISSTGVASLSIAAIAQQVGIVPSALYRHFAGKEEVLDAVLQLLERRLMDNVARARKEAAGALGALRVLMIRHVRMLDEFRAVPLVLFSDSLYADHPERKTQVHRIITTYLKSIQKMVRAGQDQGIIRGDLTPQMAAVLFLGMIVPAAVLSHLSEGRYDFEGHLAAAWPAYERAVTCRCDPKEDQSIKPEDSLKGRSVE